MKNTGLYIIRFVGGIVLSVLFSWGCWIVVDSIIHYILHVIITNVFAIENVQTENTQTNLILRQFLGTTFDYHLFTYNLSRLFQGVLFLLVTGVEIAIVGAIGFVLVQIPKGNKFLACVFTIVISLDYILTVLRILWLDQIYPGNVLYYIMSIIISIIVAYCCSIVCYGLWTLEENKT